MTEHLKAPLSVEQLQARQYQARNVGERAAQILMAERDRPRRNLLHRFFDYVDRRLSR